MTVPGLSTHEIDMMAGVFRRHPEVVAVKLFGSRAKGTHVPGSDVDVAVWGEMDDIQAQAVAAELDALPLPYRFEVKRFAGIRLQALREHIERVGIVIYPAGGQS